MFTLTRQPLPTRTHQMFHNHGILRPIKPKLEIQILEMQRIQRARKHSLARVLINPRKPNICKRVKFSFYGVFGDQARCYSRRRKQFTNKRIQRFNQILQLQDSGRIITRHSNHGRWQRRTGIIYRRTSIDGNRSAISVSINGSNSILRHGP